MKSSGIQEQSFNAESVSTVQSASGFVFTCKVGRMDSFNERWKTLGKGIAKITASGEPETPFTSEDAMELYTTIYELCKSSEDQCRRVYNEYLLTFKDYLSSTVLPSLQNPKHDEFLLRDFANRWSNHKRMVYRMSHCFHYLNRYYIPQNGLTGLNEVAAICFRDLVYANMKEKIRDAVLLLIDQEREGRVVDRALLKNVVDIFFEIGMGQMQYYVNDFELPMLERTSAYYTQKASKWIWQEDECLKAEKDRASHYLHSSSETKLLETARNALLIAHTAQLQL